MLPSLPPSLFGIPNVQLSPFQIPVMPHTLALAQRGIQLDGNGLARPRKREPMVNTDRLYASTNDSRKD